MTQFYNLPQITQILQIFHPRIRANGRCDHNLYNLRNLWFIYNNQ